MQLRPRLAAALELIPEGDAIADVCCDHAYLAIAAAARGARQVIAIDVAAEPIAVATAAVARSAQPVTVRMGDGLVPLSPGEVDGVVIAGIGGLTCLEIFERTDPSSLDLRWIVLQINRSLPRVRTWLSERGWRLQRETLVRDGRRIFVTCRFVTGGERRTLTPAEAYLGRVPQDADPRLLAEHLGRREAKLADEVRGLQRGRDNEALLTERRAWLDAVRQVNAAATRSRLPKKAPDQ
ncbi:MAG: SAM-dependent methyltransferase [Myxococcales bacterium]|nr:SAM-dependent methyltransferase [Myxococcales bacterium]